MLLMDKLGLVSSVALAWICCIQMAFDGSVVQVKQKLWREPDDGVRQLVSRLLAQLRLM